MGPKPKPDLTLALELQQKLRIKVCPLYVEFGAKKFYLPRPLKIPTITTLRTLGDIRALLGNLPADRRQKNTWRHVADRLHHAARGGDINDAMTPLRLVLQLERVPCLPQ